MTTTPIEPATASPGTTPPETTPPCLTPSETTAFDAPSEHAAALDRVIALATDEILVFDSDLAPGGWGTVARSDALRSFLLGKRLARVQIIVHNTLYIERSLPRLVRLLRNFSHKLEILRTVGDGRNAWDGFALVDRMHLVHRFHLDSTRGELSLHDAYKAQQLRERYDELVQHTESGVNATQLGL